MASTYVNDLRLNEMATGDASGTWGEVTNTNLELIAEAFSYGTEAITTNADTHTTTIADGATDPGRSMYLKYTGTLDSACTITIGPNTISKMWFIENATSGSQNIIIKQGSGATITIPPGDVKVVYSDGAGSGAAVVDAFASLNVVDLKVQDDLTVTDDATIGGTLGVTGILTCTDDIIIGDGKTIGSASDVDAMTIASNGQVTFTQTLIGTALDISGDIDVDGTTNLDVVDIDGAVDMASTLAVTGAITGATAAFTQTNTVNSPVSARYNGSNKKVAFNINNSNGQGFIASNSNSVVGSANQTYDITNTAGKIDFGTGITIDTAVSGSAGGTITYVNNADFLPTGIVFNEGGVDVDFRVESNSNSHMFFVDGGNNRVGINKSTPAADVHLKQTGDIGNGNGVGMMFESGVGSQQWILQAGLTGISNSYFTIRDVTAGTNVLSFVNSSGAATFSSNVTVGADLTIPEYIYHTSDSNTYFGFPGGDEFELVTAGQSRMKLVGSGTTFNEGGVDLDFRVESDGNANMLFVDGGNDAVGVGCSTVGNSTLEVRSTGVDGTFANAIGFQYSGNANEANTISTSVSSNAALSGMKFNISDGGGSSGKTVVATFLRNQIIFNDNSNDIDFRVESNGNANMLFVDGGNDKIGIGTATPTTALEVSGTVTATYIAASNSVFAGSGGVGGISLKATYSGATTFQVQNTGNVTISGALSKGSGSFRIDHPLESKKDTHHLVHSFVEAPQADNIYRGKVDLVDGSATVNIDTVAGMTEGTFVALNTDVQCFTTNESDWDAVKGSVSGNILTISCQNTSSTATVSWLVIGERQDQHMKDTDWTDADGKVIVEPTK